MYCCFAVDLMLLLLHKGRSVFSHLSPCTFQVLSFLPSAVILSSLAAEGGGRENAHRRRWLIFHSTCARGWENSAAAASSSTSPLHVRGRKAHATAAQHIRVHQHWCVSSVAWGMVLGGWGGGCVVGAGCTPLYLENQGLLLAGAPPAQTHGRACRGEGAAAAHRSQDNPLPW